MKIQRIFRHEDAFLFEVYGIFEHSDSTSTSTKPERRLLVADRRHNAKCYFIDTETRAFRPRISADATTIKLRKELVGTRILRLGVSVKPNAVAIVTERTENESSTTLEFRLNRRAMLVTKAATRRFFSGKRVDVEALHLASFRYDRLSKINFENYFFGDASNAREKATHIGKNGETRQRIDRLVKRLKTHKRKLERKKFAIEKDMSRADKSSGMRALAQLLLARADSLKDIRAKTEIIDFDGSSKVEVDLTRNTAAELANSLFRKAKRFERGRAAGQERLRTVMADIDKVEIDLAVLNGPEITDTEVQNLIARYEKSTSNTTHTPTNKMEQMRKPFFEYRGHADSVILVGRSGKDNDTLLRTYTRPSDLWFHVRGSAGSHVILKRHRSQVVSEQALLDAATLAAHYSPQRHEQSVEVDYCERRYVRKPKGAAPGLVLVTRTKTLAFRIEQGRLDRIFGRD